MYCTQYVTWLRSYTKVLDKIQRMSWRRVDLAPNPSGFFMVFGGLGPWFLRRRGILRYAVSWDLPTGRGRTSTFQVRSRPTKL